MKIYVKKGVAQASFDKLRTGLACVSSFLIQARRLYHILNNKVFRPSTKIIDSVEKEGPFKYKNYQNVKLACDKSILKSITEKPLHKKQKIEPIDKEKFSLTVPTIPEYEIMLMVLNQAGLIKVVEPAALRKQVREVAQKILKSHS